MPLAENVDFKFPADFYACNDRAQGLDIVERFPVDAADDIFRAKAGFVCWGVLIHFGDDCSFEIGHAKALGEARVERSEAHPEPATNEPPALEDAFHDALCGV